MAKSDVESTLEDHEDRIRALELAVVKLGEAANALKLIAIVLAASFGVDLTGVM